MIQIKWKLGILVIISAVLLSSSLIVLSKPSYNLKNEDGKVHGYPYKITFHGRKTNQDLTVTWSYKVKSDGQTPISFWVLYSDCFTEGALESVSELYDYEPSVHKLTFTQPYGVNEERMVSFILDASYEGCKVGRDEYFVQVGSDLISGVINGPTPPSQ